jgi:RNA polymerase primary sigma factor
MDDPSPLEDPVAVYLTELRKIPTLNRDEEIACVEHVRAQDDFADASAKRLVEANLSLVVSIAERYRGRGVHILDLIQRGNDGLLRAVQALTNEQKDNFPAHAADHIERAIVDAIANSRNS